jgi:hypothetical protein
MRLLALVVVGRLVVWLLQTSGPTTRLWKLRPFLEELGSCDLCLGCWVFPIGAWALGVNLLDPVYIPVVSQVLTGWLVAFGVHLAAIGWRDKWGVTVVD